QTQRAGATVRARRGRIRRHGAHPYAPPLARPPYARITRRFTCKVRMMSAIRNPDAFWAVVTEDGLAWARQPAAFVIAASYTFNLPLLVENQTGAALQVRAEFQGTTAKSEFAGAELAPRATGGYFLRVVESEPGPRKGRVVVQTAGRELTGEIAFDVRPLVHLSVKLVEPGGRPAAARVYLNGLRWPRLRPSRQDQPLYRNERGAVLP